MKLILTGNEQELIATVDHDIREMGNRITDALNDANDITKNSVEQEAALNTAVRIMESQRIRNMDKENVLRRALNRMRGLAD